MPPNKRPSLASLAVYVFVVGAALFLAVSNAIQTWPNNAVGYAVGASNPIPTIQARWFPGTQQTSVLGRPTLAPDFLNRVLVAAHSPAQGTGQALYALSVQYGIDDAYALGFFKHESGYGTTGVARVTRSLGNIRCSAGYTCISGYRAYSSWQAGYADWYQLILTLYIKQWHLTTPAQIIPVYAPASDGNDPPAYIADVEQSVSAWRKGDVQI
jgi:Mannosyl-glycoprotein endo-beta-N-acetylglucosaminidase